MRTQQEIKDKIGLLTKSNSDPGGVQRTILVKKLHYENALKYMKRADRYDLKIMSKWAKRSSIEKPDLMTELYKLMFKCYDCVIEKDLPGAVIHFQGVVVYLWLLGKEQERFAKHIMDTYVQKNGNFIKSYGKIIWDDICREFGWPVKVFYREWEHDERIDE